MTAPMTTLPEEAVKAAQKAYRECEGDSTESHRAALTAALPFLPVQGAVKADTLKLIERMAFGYEVMFEKLCHISGTSGADQSWYRAKAREATERLSPLHSITTESNKSVPGDCKRKYQDFMARILSALEPSAARELALEEGDLNARLKAKGMYSIEELMGELPLDRWRIHSGMTDLKFFGEWLERKTREYCTMRAAYEVGDKDESDDLYEWVLAHYGAFSDVLVNFRAALSSPDHADAGKVEGDGWSGDLRGMKIALEQAWESNRERQSEINILQDALRNFTDGRDISSGDALEIARSLTGGQQ